MSSGSKAWSLMEDEMAILKRAEREQESDVRC